MLSFWSGPEPVAASGLAQASVLCVRYGSSAQRDTLGGIVGGLFDQCGTADVSRIGPRIALDRVLWPKEGKPEL